VLCDLLNETVELRSFLKVEPKMSPCLVFRFRRREKSVWEHFSEKKSFESYATAWMVLWTTNKLNIFDSLIKLAWKSWRILIETIQELQHQAVKSAVDSDRSFILFCLSIIVLRNQRRNSYLPSLLHTSYTFDNYYVCFVYLCYFMLLTNK
jgi:hypothetical protein